MFCRKSIRSFTLVLAAFYAGACSAAPPKVAKATPDNGEVGVSPALREIRITFDQPMAKGMSVVGGGEEFPEMIGRPRWDSARTLVIRVRLKPNHDYWLSVNNDQ